MVTRTVYVRRAVTTDEAHLNYCCSSTTPLIIETINKQFELG